MKNYLIMLACLLLVLNSVRCTAPERSVTQVMDDVVTRLYADISREELADLNNEKIMMLLSDDEKNVLASRFWMFDVNVPVIVSVMRHQEQQVLRGIHPGRDLVQRARQIVPIGQRHGVECSRQPRSPEFRKARWLGGSRYSRIPDN